MKRLLNVLFLLFSSASFADEVQSLSDAMLLVRNNCGGISDSLNDIKKMAGVGTAISAVGTAVAGGATAVGIAKTATDSDLASINQKIAELEAAVANPESLPEIDLENLEQELRFYVKSNPINIETVDDGLDSLRQEQQVLDEKSKKMGDARTGLMATATATNIASAAISGTNRIDTDFSARITSCLAAIDVLSAAKIQNALNGNTTDTEISQADKIIATCNKYDITDVEKINNRALGATVSSGVGAATGLAGTITSGVANTDATREDADKSKSLNTVSNVLAGVTTAASLTATVFNATQIAAAKRIIEVAEQCEEALK